jgi:hypothetical protein
MGCQWSTTLTHGADYRRFAADSRAQSCSDPRATASNAQKSTSARTFLQAAGHLPVRRPQLECVGSLEAREDGSRERQAELD